MTAHELCDATAAKLRRKELGGRVVTLKLRQADFQTITRQKALVVPTDLAGPLAAVADELLTEALSATGWRRIRLLGVRVSDLGPLARQLDLFSATPLRDAKLSAALHQLEERFGAQVVRRAATLDTTDRSKDYWGENLTAETAAQSSSHPLLQATVPTARS